jgi:hypothetical protein
MPTQLRLERTTLPYEVKNLDKPPHAFWNQFTNLDSRVIDWNHPLHRSCQYLKSHTRSKGATIKHPQAYSSGDMEIKITVPQNNFFVVCTVLVLTRKQLQ